MKYVLLNYARRRRIRTQVRDMHPGLAAVLERPDVTGCVRLQPAESATTVTLEREGRC